MQPSEACLSYFGNFAVFFSAEPRRGVSGTPLEPILRRRRNRKLPPFRVSFRLHGHVRRETSVFQNKQAGRPATGALFFNGRIFFTPLPIKLSRLFFDAHVISPPSLSTRKISAAIRRIRDGKFGGEENFCDVWKVLITMPAGIRGTAGKKGNLLSWGENCEKNWKSPDWYRQFQPISLPSHVIFSHPDFSFLHCSLSPLF